MILHANQALRNSLKPGTVCSEINGILFETLTKEGLKPLSPMAGHGLGRAVHEPPFLTEENDVILEPGMVIAVEPTIRLAGAGSVAIEDTVVITEGGYECLTTARREINPYG